MAHFRATIQGARGEASRLGSKSSGLSARVASWAGAVTVELREENGVDMALVCLSTHHGHGADKVLYDGPVAGVAK